MTVHLPPLVVGIERVAPLCEMRDCTNRADYFWMLLPARPDRFGWLPMRHEHVETYQDDLRMEVVPIAETSAEPRHIPPLP